MSDYAQVKTPARIAVYDDMLSAPRVTEIQPMATTEFIEALASKIYEQSKTAGGSIPYTVIREVSENFIHAQFTEATVSILDDGNTIRFADQGPGIAQKENAQLPGFTSATEPMKQFIRGVGSGLPIVKEYLDFSHGAITIEDNLKTGAVVTVSLKPKQEVKPTPIELNSTLATIIAPLKKRERELLPLLLREGALGITEIRNLTNWPQSSVHAMLIKLENAQLIETIDGQKRILTELGRQVANSL